MGLSSNARHTSRRRVRSARLNRRSLASARCAGWQHSGTCRQACRHALRTAGSSHGRHGRGSGGQHAEQQWPADEAASLPSHGGSGAAANGRLHTFVSQQTPARPSVRQWDTGDLCQAGAASGGWSATVVGSNRRSCTLTALSTSLGMQTTMCPPPATAEATAGTREAAPCLRHHTEAPRQVAAPFFVLAPITGAICPTYSTRRQLQRHGVPHGALQSPSAGLSTGAFDHEMPVRTTIRTTLGSTHVHRCDRPPQLTHAWGRRRRVCGSSVAAGSSCHSPTGSSSIQDREAVYNH